ncbi:MAG TPA: alpha-hydroxy-acid oxidizing protein, partial [Actinomycetota bacterium]|nr:alpha-hydroxy-acid oxidizing protein [Actinomycetota bacterium]
DARRAADAGVDAVIVSNHGGRQVDGAIGALDALPNVVAAAADRIEVLFDSGIRSGSDAFKAIALGARAVLLARPYLWGLALGGEDGVRAVLRSLMAELDLTVALSGFTNLDEITTEALERVE